MTAKCSVRTVPAMSCSLSSSAAVLGRSYNAIGEVKW